MTKKSRKKLRKKIENNQTSKNEKLRIKYLEKKTYLQGMFGFDDQSHMISDAVNSPWTSSGLTKWLI